MTLTHDAFRTAIWLALNNPRTDSIPENVCPPDLLSSVTNELEKADYVVVARTLGGVSMQIKDDHAHIGRTMVRKYRTDAAQMRMLEWVREHEDQGSSLDVADSPAANDFTDPLTRDDFAKADKVLRDEGFIKGTGAWGHGTIRPELTAAGNRCLDRRYAPSDLPTHQTATHTVNAPTYTNHITGPVGGIQQGEHNTMSVEQSNNPDLAEALDIVAKMKQLILNEDLDDATRSEVLELHQELEDSVHAKKRTTIVNALISAIATQVTSFAGTQIGALGDQLLQLPWFN